VLDKAICSSGFQNAVALFKKLCVCLGNLAYEVTIIKSSTIKFLVTTVNVFAAVAIYFRS